MSLTLKNFFKKPKKQKKIHHIRTITSLQQNRRDTSEPNGNFNITCLKWDLKDSHICLDLAYFQPKNKTEK